MKDLIFRNAVVLLETKLRDTLRKYLGPTSYNWNSENAPVRVLRGKKEEFYAETVTETFGKNKVGKGTVKMFPDGKLKVTVCLYESINAGVSHTESFDIYE